MSSPPPISTVGGNPVHYWIGMSLALLFSLLTLLPPILSGHILLPAAAIDEFHATLFQLTAMRTNGQPILWDPTAILGGYPIYAAAEGGVFYPGYFAFWVMNNPFLAWHITVVAHLLVATLLLTNKLRPGSASFPRTVILLGWLFWSAEALLTLQTPAAFLALPWAVWAWVADVDSGRPLYLRISHWMLCAGIAGLLGPIGWAMVALAALGSACVQQQWVPLIGAVGGCLLAGLQLLPWAMQPETHDWKQLGGVVLLALRPAAFLAVILSSPSRWNWWPLLGVLALLLTGVYPADRSLWLVLALVVAALLALVPLPKGVTWQDRFPSAAAIMLLVHLLGSGNLVGLPTEDLKTLVNDTRSVLPRESHPSIAIVQPERAGLNIDGMTVQWDPREDAGAYFSIAAGPLLWNLAPDRDLAAAAVALPWSPRWREQLDNLGYKHAGTRGQKITQLIHFEYVAQGLGLNTLAGTYGDLPMLDYRRIDGKHIGQLPSPPNAADAERDALQEEVIERLSAVAGEPEELPKPPEAWKQQPVLGRYFYQAKGNLPFAILADRPAKPLSLTPGPWTLLQEKALDKLQSDTPYPFFTSPTEKVRYLVLADDSPDGTVQSPATIVVDRGEAVDVSPQIERHSDGLTMHMRIPRTTSPWLILRQSLVTGWSCTVDEVLVPIARADGVWMAIPLPTDKDATIALTYTVPGLTIGRWLSAAMAAIWLVLGVIGMRAAGRFSSTSPAASTTDAAPPVD